MCSSKDPLITDERTTTEPGIVNKESNLPWELTAGCGATTGDTIGLFIQGHVDFSSELCNAHKHISMQQQKLYLISDINLFDNYLDCLFICKKLLPLRTSLKYVIQVSTWLSFSALLVVGFISRTGYLCCIDFLPFPPGVPRVYRHDHVTRLHVFQVNTSLLNKHYIFALDA